MRSSSKGTKTEYQHKMLSIIWSFHSVFKSHKKWSPSTNQPLTIFQAMHLLLSRGYPASVDGVTDIH